MTQRKSNAESAALTDSMAANRRHWDELASIHFCSAFYDVDGFLAGKTTLTPLETAEVGDVRGKSLLHLQCHLGLDTLSWARLGARATGVDFSPRAIALARRLARRTGVDARFIRANVYDLPRRLRERYDVVVTTYGVLCWLPDLTRWARVVSRFLRPGGAFYIADFHPFTDVFNMDHASTLQPAQSYFHRDEPVREEPSGSYADRGAAVHTPAYEWQHPLSDVVNALIAAGLRIHSLREHDVCAYRRFPFLVQGGDRWWRLPEGMPRIPLMFSLKATRPTS